MWTLAKNLLDWNYTKKDEVNKRWKMELWVCLNVHDALIFDEVNFTYAYCTSLAYLLRAMIIQFAWQVILINSLVLV